MKKIWNRAAEKLRSERGDSLAEVLIALLISAVALVMLATMISTSSSMTRESKKTMDKYYQGIDSLTLRGSAPEGTVTLTGTVSFYRKNEGGKVIVSYTSAGVLSSEPVPVQYRTNQLGSKTSNTVIAYWK